MTQEKKPMFETKASDLSVPLMGTDKSRGNPNVKLARVIAVWDMTVKYLGWDDCTFSQIIRDTQASVDGTYHKDLKDVAIAQEIEARAERKGKNGSIGLKILQ